jgi:thioredoxin-related protein
MFTEAAMIFGRYLCHNCDALKDDEHENVSDISIEALFAVFELISLASDSKELSTRSGDRR